MAISTAQLSLYIYTGTSGSYQTSDLKYTLQKERINEDDFINFEKSNLVRDFIDVTFNNDYLSKCVWVTAIANLFDDNNEPYTFSNPQTNTFIALDGYGYFEDRRPSSNCDPYLVTSKIFETTCLN